MRRTCQSTPARSAHSEVPTLAGDSVMPGTALRRATSGNWRIAAAVARAAICIGLALSLAACATQTESPLRPIPGPTTPLPPPPAATSHAVAKPSKTVTASYQGTDTAGRETASGEPYNPHKLTAASRNLPMGSTVKVTNPATGHSVKVLINDRGPFVRGRSLDLSKSAAEKIGIVHKGVARVKIAPISSQKHSAETQSPSSTSTASAVAGNHANPSP